MVEPLVRKESLGFSKRRIKVVEKMWVRVGDLSFDAHGNDEAKNHHACQA